MLSLRILSSIVLIPVVLFIIYYTPFVVFSITIALLEFIALYELLNITKNTDTKINLIYVIAGMLLFTGDFLPSEPRWILIRLFIVDRATLALAICILFYSIYGIIWGKKLKESAGNNTFFLTVGLILISYLLIQQAHVRYYYDLGLLGSSFIWGVVLFISTLLYFLYELTKKSKFELPSNNISMNIFSVIYIAWFLNHMLLLRKWSPHYVLFVLLITWANDTGAYAIGRMFGKHKLAPTVSPGKTWEGSIAGICSGLIVAGLFKFFVLKFFSYMVILAGALFISIAGQIGDLVESLIKRFCNVKDSGNLIPGHGGLLDRIDSLIFAFPAAYYFFNILQFMQQ